MKYECCKNVDNLDTEVLDKSRTVRICRVCGRRHYTLEAAPGVYGLRGADHGRGDKVG